MKAVLEAHVLSPPLFRPRTPVQAQVRSATSVTLQALRADSRGRVALTVPLGPANPADEFSAGAKLPGQGPPPGGAPASGSPGTIVYTTMVRLVRPRQHGHATG